MTSSIHKLIPTKSSLCIQNPHYSKTFLKIGQIIEQEHTVWLGQASTLQPKMQKDWPDTLVRFQGISRQQLAYKTNCQKTKWILRIWSTIHATIGVNFGVNVRKTQKNQQNINFSYLDFAQLLYRHKNPHNTPEDKLQKSLIGSTSDHNHFRR